MDIEEYLSHFDKFTKDPTLEAMEYIMEKFDNPHKKLKYIHIAGTNGKGSVSEMLNNCLIKAGYKVGKFVSPHLITFNDGICINNKPITDKEVEEILIPLSSVVTEYNQTHEIPVKWFEVITSLVLIYFYKQNCDIAVIETGLGGTLDCTNIITPLVSVITKVGYDHMDILGHSLKEIATHKAGIIKQNSETVFIDTKEVTEVIQEKCAKENNKLHLINTKEITNYSYNQDYQKFDYKEFKNIEINLKGKVQTQNAVECLETIDILRGKGFKIPEEAIREGLKTVIHKARMEKINETPCIIFDGGHNESAIQNLKENIKQYYSNKKHVYIISILQTKDHNTIIEELSSDKEAIFYFTDGVPEKPYVAKEVLLEEANRYIEKERTKTKSLEDAINETMDKYSDRDIFIVGSFYVYKKVMELLKKC